MSLCRYMCISVYVYFCACISVCKCEGVSYSYKKTMLISFYNKYLIIQCIIVTNLLKYLKEKHGNCVLTFEPEI